MCVLVYCQYINIQCRGPQLCALMYSIGFLHRTVCICVPACSHLHVLSCTSGVPRHEAIEFYFVPVTWHVVRSQARLCLCCLPHIFYKGPLLFHTKALLTDQPWYTDTLWTTSPSPPLCLSCSVMFMWMVNVSLCTESLAQTGAHCHRICYSAFNLGHSFSFLSQLPSLLIVLKLSLKI